MRSLTTGAFIVVLFTAPAVAQEKITEHTFKLPAGAKPPAATIGDMAWLAGHWTGEALGGVSEEMYRLVKNGKPVFYELLTIVEENGSLVLRLKHFHPNLKGWEEKEKTVDFPLVALEKGAVHFEGMSFHPRDDGTLLVYLVIGSKDGSVREEAFPYKRQPSGAR
jgi:Domain of unknown function (DUF6265)